MPLNDIGFEVVLASPPDYERLTAEIFYDGKFIALISHERQEFLFDIELPRVDWSEKDVAGRVDLKGLQDSIILACERLKGESP